MLVGSSFVASAAFGDVILVPADAPTITIAINLAEPGDEIEVGPGTYFERVDFGGKSLVLRSTDGPEATIIDATGQFDSAIRLDGATDPLVRIEGFTIRNADAAGIDGGGIRCADAEPTIVDCIIESNNANFGGALFANGGFPRLIRCTIRANQATDGAGLYIADGVIEITDCVFIDNVASRFGGALRTADVSGLIVGSTFEGNVAELNGGAGDFAADGSIVFDACTFTANSAGNVGGAIQAASADLRFLNCLFERNESVGAGAAVNVFAPGDFATLVNCTVVENTGSNAALAVLSSTGLRVHNSIVWANTPTGVAGAAAIAYSCLEQAYPGIGNIQTDPMFVDPAGEFRLVAASPCVDAAATTLLPTSIDADLDGAARVRNIVPAPTGVAAFGYIVDMGAYERQPAGPTSTCPGDLDGDGVVGGADLAILLGAWGVCPG